MPDLNTLIREIIQEDLWLVIFTFLLFVRSCPKKPHFIERLITGFLAAAALFAISKVSDWQALLPDAVQMLIHVYVILPPVISALYMKVMFQCNWNMMLFGSLAGLCTQEIMFGCWEVIAVVFPSVATFWGELLICGIIGGGLAAALYYFLAVEITPRSLQMLQKRSLFPMLLLYLFSLMLISFSTDIAIFIKAFIEPIREALAAADGAMERLRAEDVRISSICSSLAGSAMILFALRNMLRYSRSELERELLEQIREQDRKQYARFRSNVDYINIKSHDLKHYLELIQKNAAVPQEELRQVSESLLQLDAETDSGNKTLDLILTDRRMACEGQGITLVFQTDGTRLEQLDVIDIYTIFCNILDNAMEHMKDLPEAERCIRLGIRTIHSMVFIHQENPLCGAVELKDGLPVSTKNDSMLHGFGLKSVQNTVKKCGGELVIRAESGWYELDICFPQKTE